MTLITNYSTEKHLFVHLVGVSLKSLHHDIIPTLVDGHLGAALIHADTNDILNCAFNHINIASNTFQFAKNCGAQNFSDVFNSSILVKKNPELKEIINITNDA